MVSRIFRGREESLQRNFKLVHIPAVYQNRTTVRILRMLEKLLKTRANRPSCRGAGEKDSANAIQEAIKTQLPVILREIGER